MLGGHVSVQDTIYMMLGVSVCQWHNGKSVFLGQCVCVCHSSFSLSSWSQGVCLTHITSIKVMSRSLPHKSLFTSPTLLKSLSGLISEDVEIANTTGYCLTIRTKWGNSYTWWFHHRRGSVSGSPVVLSCSHFIRTPQPRHRHPWMNYHLRGHSKY